MKTTPAAPDNEAPLPLDPTSPVCNECAEGDV